MLFNDVNKIVLWNESNIINGIGEVKNCSMYRVSGSRSCPLSRKRQTTHKSGSLSQDKNLLVLI